MLHNCFLSNPFRAIGADVRVVEVTDDRSPSFCVEVEDRPGRPLFLVGFRRGDCRFFRVLEARPEDRLLLVEATVREHEGSQEGMRELGLCRWLCGRGPDGWFAEPVPPEAEARDIDGARAALRPRMRLGA